MDNAASLPDRKTILVVDDNPDIRRLIRLSLEDPYIILEAEDGTSALAMIQQHLPSLVILDIMMPGAIDGLQVLERIKQTPELQHILVVMLTARGQSKDFQFGLQKGADAYFVKPFSPLVLLQWISSRI